MLGGGTVRDHCLQAGGGRVVDARHEHHRWPWSNRSQPLIQVTG